MKLLESAESVPTFNYAYTFGKLNGTPNGKMALTGKKKANQ